MRRKKEHMWCFNGTFWTGYTIRPNRRKVIWTNLIMPFNADNGDDPFCRANDGTSRRWKFNQTTAMTTTTTTKNSTHISAFIIKSFSVLLHLFFYLPLARSLAMVFSVFSCQEPERYTFPCIRSICFNYIWYAFVPSPFVPLLMTDRKWNRERIRAEIKTELICSGQNSGSHSIFFCIDCMLYSRPEFFFVGLHSIHVCRPIDPTNFQIDNSTHTQ